MIDEISYTYAAFKDIAAQKKFFWQMRELDCCYEIWGYDLPTKYSTVIYKPNCMIQGIDLAAELVKQTDFETNYKAECNRPNAISPTAAQTQFFGRTIEMSAGATMGYCEWQLDVDAYISKVLPCPIDAQKGDYVDFEIWADPGILGPDAVKVGQYAYTVPLRGSIPLGWIYGSGGGLIKSYFTVRCVYHKDAGTARDFNIIAEFMI